MNWIDTADTLARALDAGHPSAPADDPQAARGDESATLGQFLLEQGVIRQMRDIEIAASPVAVFGSLALIGGRSADGRFMLPRVCGGSGFTRESAQVRAYAEAMERYCAAVYDASDLRLDVYRHLRDDAVAPGAFALYGPEQYDAPAFEYRPFLEDTPVNWAQGYSLTQQKPVFVPAAFVYLPYWPTGTETPIGLFPSTGLACGRSFLEAALRGLLEVIERDAIMLMWLNRAAARQIDAKSLGDTPAGKLAGSDENGKIHIFDITTDVRIPTRFALLTATYRGRSLVSCGAATHWDGQAANTKAVLEALALRLSVQKVIRTHPMKSHGLDPRAVREIDDHLNFYTNPDHLSALDFLLQMEALPETRQDVSIPGRNMAGQLKACLELLAERGLEAIVVDVTRPELAGSGLYAVRVIVPGMIPLTFGSGYVCAAGRRLQEVPVALGYRRPGEALRLNPAPHPFA